MSAQVAPSPHEQAEKLREAGLSQVKNGHIDDAIASFKKGLEIAPRDARLLDAAGGAYSLKGDLETAQQYFTESLLADPDSIPTKQNLGIALFSLGRYVQASEQFLTIYKVPGKPRAVASLFLGLIAHKESKCKEALPLLEASGDLLYQYADATLTYSECEYQVGDIVRAERGLAAFDRLTGTTSTQYGQAADLYMHLGLSDKAREDRSKAAGEQPSDSPAAVVERAALLEKSNRLDEAQRLLEQQATSSPTFEMLLELAKVAKQRGDFAVAMKALKQAAKTAPDREDSYLEFSTICADHGNDQLALDSAEVGLEHVPDSYRLTVQKGVVQDKLGHLNDAQETLTKAIGLQQDNSVALLSLAVVQAHSGRPDAAEQTLANAIQRFPDNYYMHYFRGKLMLQFANTNAVGADPRDSAKRSFEKAIQLNPKFADSYYQLSNLYATDSARLAEQALRKCLELDPNHLPAQYSLARLYIRTGRKAEGEALLARFKTQQRSEELQQQKQLRIEVAENQNH